MRPRLPFIEKMPQKAAGTRTEPPPSEPSAAGTLRADTAAAEPLEEPPEVSAGFQGLRVGPNSAETLEAVQPNSVVVVLAIRMAPAAFRRSTIGASCCATLVGKDPRAAGGLQPGAVEQVLHRDRNARAAGRAPRP